MRPIDADALTEKVCGNCPGNDCAPDATDTVYGCMLAESIDQMPTIEAEPVIHCKDCAFWESKRVSCEGLARCRTGESGYRYRFGHDFCSRAQKREEVNEDETD